MGGTPKNSTAGANGVGGNASSAHAPAAESRAVSASSPSVDWSKPRVAAILKAATKCFSRTGFETTTAEIAKELSVPKSIIYHYFQDKTALIREVQKYAYRRHLERVREVLQNAGEASGKRAVDVLKLLWQASNTRNIGFDLGIWSALRHDPELRKEALALQQEHRRITAERVARALGIEGADQRRTEPLTTLIVAALTGLSITAHVDGEEAKVEKAHDLFMRLLEAGIEKFGERIESDADGSTESVIPPAAYQEPAVHEGTPPAGP